MNATSLGIWIQAQELIIRVEAMKAANLERNIKGQSIAYTEEQFDKAASEMASLGNYLTEKYREGYAE